MIVFRICIYIPCPNVRGAWQAHLLSNSSSFFSGLKGVSAKVIILEEASRLDQSVGQPSCTAVLLHFFLIFNARHRFFLRLLFRF